jgi:WD40 repeat protein
MTYQTTTTMTMIFYNPRTTRFQSYQVTPRLLRQTRTRVRISHPPHSASLIAHTGLTFIYFQSGPFHPPFGRCERLEKHGDKVTCLVFYGDGLISGSNDKQLVLWRPSGCFQDTDQDTFQDTDSRVRVASIREEDENEKPSMASARSVRAPGGAIRALAISGDQNNLFTAGSDGAVRVWDISDVATKKEGFVLLRTFVGGHDGFCVSVSVSISHLPHSTD